MTLYYSEYIPPEVDPVGRLRLLASEQGLCGLYMDSDKHHPKVAAQAWQHDPDHFVRVLNHLPQQLDEYFAGQRQHFDVPLDLQGTAFQHSVWRGLMDIPYGQTISYGELARRIGNPKAMRAVGLANGRNPVSIIVPCHRVIGADGSLTGYGGGMERKRYLLELEGRQTE